MYRFSRRFFIGLILCLVVNFSSGWYFKIGAEELHNSVIGKLTPVVFQSPGLNSESFVARGLANYTVGKYNEAVTLWLSALKTSHNDIDAATIHANLASAYRQLGKIGQSIQQLEQAIKIYSSKKDIKSRNLLYRASVDQAQNYNALGQFTQAFPLLRTAIESTHKHRDQQTETVAQGALGNAYFIAGEYDKALEAYQNSLRLATTLNNSEYVLTALNNQVEILDKRSKEYFAQATSAQSEGDDDEEARLLRLAKQDKDTALTTATRAIQESKTNGSLHEIKSLLNIIQLLQESENPGQDLLTDYRRQAIKVLKSLPDTQGKAYALINSSNSVKQLDSGSKLEFLEWALAVARNVSDPRTESFALGAIGHFYELNKQFSKALELTRQAQFVAQQVNANDSLYRWQWQAGRIQRDNGDTEAATSSYLQAVTTLQSIRGDIVVADKELQFDVRDKVEPVYRGLMALLLEKSQKQRSNSQEQKSNVEQALLASDSLKLTEIQSFFGDECLEVAQAISNLRDTLIQTNTAAIYSIILDKSTYIILQSPNGSLKSYPVLLEANQLQSKIEQFRFLLEKIESNDYLTDSQQLYNLLIRPLEADLDKIAPSTLVFINDGVLRNIPMAALHDGKRFLIEKYPIASTLDLSLTPSKNLHKTQKALIFGLTVGVPPFNPLPGISVETKDVQNIMGGTRFLDQNFTLENLRYQTQLNSYPILHIATHSEFGGATNLTRDTLQRQGSSHC